MADAKIDKSLEEIIKERKISGRAPRGGAAGRGMGRGRGRGGRGAGRPAPSGQLDRPGYGAIRFARRPNNGSIQKRRSGGLPNSPHRAMAAAASMNGHWDHDLYQNGGGLRRQNSALLVGQSPGPAKLVISNLDFGVNDQDIKGLFQEFGNIRKAAVHYDRSGRSLGTADVLFDRRQDAIRALKKYNGVSLDGRPMDIQLVAPLAAVVPVMPPRRDSAPAPRRGGFGVRGGAFGGQRGRGRGGRGGASQRQPKPPKSSADLDAELDAYNAKMQTD